ncbi:MAG: hypothetical protein CL933_16980 [Deltaproteobacteria bacterium]|nr:hypothetical protein [Deltaproteobacteria bacterium]
MWFESSCLTEQAYYRWCNEYGGLRLDQAKCLEKLEKANARLNRLLAEQALDNLILKKAAMENFCRPSRDFRPRTVFAKRRFLTPT